MQPEADRLAQDMRSVQALVRFSIRIFLLAMFSTFAGAAFGRTMLLLSAALCILSGLVRREHPLAGALTHWDEAAAYGLLYSAAGLIGGAESGS